MAEADDDGREEETKGGEKVRNTLEEGEGRKKVLAAGGDFLSHTPPSSSVAPSLTRREC